MLTGTVNGDVDGCDPALAPRYLCTIPAGKGEIPKGKLADSQPGEGEAI